MLAGFMRRRLLPLALSVLLLLAQQLGAQHLLAHVLQPGEHGHAAQAAWAPAAHAGDPAHTHAPDNSPAQTEADAGDALCQVCLVLATLAAVAGPLAWAWAARRVRSGAPLRLASTTLPRPGWAPYRARGPPARPAAA